MKKNQWLKKLVVAGILLNTGVLFAGGNTVYTVTIVNTGQTTCHLSHKAYLARTLDGTSQSSCEVTATDFESGVSNATVSAVMADKIRFTAPLTLQNNPFTLLAGDIAIEAAITANDANMTFMSLGDIHIDAPVVANNASVSIGYGMVMEDGDVTGYGADGKLMMGLSEAGFTGSLSFFEADGSTARGGSDFLTINGESYTVLTDMTGVQGIDANLSGHYALGREITGGAFTPLGTDTSLGSAFTGEFDGLGHQITGLTYNDSNQSHVGLFGGVVGAVIRNTGLRDVDIHGLRYVGGLIGSGTVVTV
ncbi:MAG: hypothetical protein Q7U38_03360, partial [Methylobacter sp.]|nr:hypothetical protein [Methylobacter sp.]